MEAPVNIYAQQIVAPEFCHATVYTLLRVLQVCQALCGDQSVSPVNTSPGRWCRDCSMCYAALF